ncbi:hypothetical protein PACTADRAFT_85854 [Pachysolen tannophilus NRRL Y-2460]|uniref:Matrin-type domain-containing protein n=1 Tax=Pachysolen tannophilus NRRL Y-2460 TaxID=669874 RepID=A0A1E4TS86_PACTA|nr:hypothetical protein PACTADRAFT_85854 [Pachysolen tannophilus NRRL Y-2460]
MPKYYCEYCRSYLTHDSMSVRKSHLMGKNHLKYYCDYYEREAKKSNVWEPSELPYEATLKEYFKGIPGSRNLKLGEVLEQENFLDEQEEDEEISNISGPGPTNSSRSAAGVGAGATTSATSATSAAAAAATAMKTTTNAYDDLEHTITERYLAPPPPLPNLPNPPPSVYHYDLRQQRLKVAELMRRHET